jgi:hypothetical protein
VPAIICCRDFWGNTSGDTIQKDGHIISESLFSGETISVKVCRGAEKATNSLARRPIHFCRKHNSDLSRVDDAGANAFTTLRMMATIYTIAAGGGRIHSVQLLLERASWVCTRRWARTWAA